jgi:hypothetical protein
MAGLPEVKEEIGMGDVAAGGEAQPQGGAGSGIATPVVEASTSGKPVAQQGGGQGGKRGKKKGKK